MRPFYLCVIAALLTVATACGGRAPEPVEPPPPPVEVPSLAKRTPAGPPRAVDADGLRTFLTSSSERVRVINFWATWCPPCLAEMPMLRTFAIQHPELDVVMVNVDSSQLHDTRVRKVIAENALTDLPHIMLDTEDPNTMLREAVDAWPEQIPVTLVVGRDGVEVARFAEALDGQKLLQAVARSSL